MSDFATSHSCPPLIKTELKPPEEEEERRYSCPSCPFDTLNPCLFRDHVKLHSSELSLNLEECVPDDINTEKTLQGLVKNSLNCPSVEHSLCSSDEISMTNSQVRRSDCYNNDYKRSEIIDSEIKVETQTESQSIQDFSNGGGTNFGYLEVEAEEVKYIRVEANLLKQNTLKCTFCSYNTTKKDHFNRHMSGHFRVRNHKCSECSYATYRKDHLDRHSLVHCKDKPGKCSKCNFSTTNKFTLVNHIRCHFKADRYKCNECKFSTMSREEFREHLKNCSARFFLCSSCNYISQRKDHLKRHLQTHYKNACEKSKESDLASL